MSKSHKIVGCEQPTTASKRRGPGKPFVKGDPRINRRGVPSKSLEFQRALREAFANSLAAPSRYARGRAKTRFDRIVEAIVERAEAGDQKAAELIFDRLGGKPSQPIEANVSGPGVVQIVSHIPRPDRERTSQHEKPRDHT